MYPAAVRWGSVAGLGLALVLVASACGQPEGDDAALPEILASSKYIDFSMPSDASQLCIDDALQEWDFFLEEVADFVGAEAIDGRVRYTWVAEAHVDDNPAWRCLKGGTGCHQGPDEGVGYVFTAIVEHRHELVHAVEGLTIGRAHWVFMEGMAVYLTSTGAAPVELETFPESFLEVLAARKIDYALSMHFVGSVIAHHGIDTYLQLRAAVPRDADVEAFAAAYEEVIGIDLATGLMTYGGAEVTGVARGPRGCDPDDRVEEIPWTSPGALATVLRGMCGDQAFYSVGREGEGLAKVFALEVESRGFYDLSLGQEGAFLKFVIDGCPGVPLSGVSLVEGQSGHLIALEAGRYTVSVTYPHSADITGEVSMSLTYSSPLPP